MASPSGHGTWRTRLRSWRRLVPVWTIREVRTLYRQSALDIGWSLLTPVITLIGFGFVLTSAFGVDGDGVPYLTFAWTGLVVWQFVANALMRGTSSLVWAADLVRKVAFPREVVPIATVLGSGLDLVIGVGVLGVLMVVQSVAFTWKIIGFVPVVAVTTLWTCAAATLLAGVTVFVRDVAHGLGVVLRIGILLTPVMYPPSDIPPAYEWTLVVNPIAVFIDSTRQCLLLGSWPDWQLLGAHAVGSVALAAVALWYLRRVDARVADVI